MQYTVDMEHNINFTYYNIPENGRIVMYAPTYRTPSAPVELDVDVLLDKLNLLGVETLKQLLDYGILF
mgnify:CR=1 FL=1